MYRKIVIGLGTTIFIILIGLGIANRIKEMNQFHDKTIDIMTQDSINKIVKKVWLDHDYLYLNDTLFIWGGNIKISSIILRDILKLEMPINLTKRRNSDTLWIISNNSKYFIIGTPE